MDFAAVAVAAAAAAAADYFAAKSVGVTLHETESVAPKVYRWTNSLRNENVDEMVYYVLAPGSKN